MNPPTPEPSTRGSLLLALLLVIFLPGCYTQWRYELGTPLPRESLPDSGEIISLREVLVELGPPHRLSAAGEGYVLAWEFWKIREDTIGLSLGALGADVLSADWGKAHIHGEFLLVTFNRQHQVTGSSFARWRNDAGGGQGIQPFMSFVSLVDVEDMVDDMPQHRWGGAALEPLPQAINNNSRPDMGQSGIQLRGTPKGTGQQSLE